jgi:Uma2 family endonuclease
MAIESEAQVAVTPHRWTIDEYYRMAETGILEPEARVELIDGVVVDMTPIGPGHGGHVKRGNRVFTRLLGDQAIVSVQDSVVLGPRFGPEPDLALLRPRADDYTESNPTAADILLIVEIADSSLVYDRGAKALLYAQAGILDYWIVNLVDGQIEVHRDPSPAGYQTIESAQRGDAISLVAFPDISIAVTDILG